jgi:hypothetical protein
MPNATTVSDADLRRARGIYTVDPFDSNAPGHHLWGERTETVSEDVEESETLEIALPSDDHVTLLTLIDRIERLKGGLPPDVRVLRKNLST